MPFLEIFTMVVHSGCCRLVRGKAGWVASLFRWVVLVLVVRAKLVRLFSARVAVEIKDSMFLGATCSSFALIMERGKTFGFFVVVRV